VEALTFEVCPHAQPAPVIGRDIERGAAKGDTRRLDDTLRVLS
jgi:hypothetical protein